MKVRSIAPNRSVSKKKQQVIFGFDRVTLWLDRPELPCDEQILKEHCSDIHVYLGQARYQARWKLEVKIFQPTKKCLELLLNALGNTVATKITYCEIAFDLPFSSKRKLRAARNDFLSCAKVRYRRHKVIRHKSTFYYGRRVSGEKKAGRVTIMYADRPSKLLNARPSDDCMPCFHLEERVTGSQELRNIGIVSLYDLLKFDHLSFWNKHLRFLECGSNKKEFGQVLAMICGAKTDVSDAALRKRTARWFDQYSIGSALGPILIMHNAMLQTAELERHLLQFTFSEWLDSLVSLKD